MVPSVPRLVNLVIIVAAIAAAAGGVVLFLRDGDSGEPVRIIPPPSVSTEANPVEAESKAYVTGAVRQPGLYVIKDGDRLADLINLAGGITEDADMQAVNVAVRVKDEDHWKVPRIGEPTLVPSDAVFVEPTRWQGRHKHRGRRAFGDASGDRRDTSAGNHPPPRATRAVQAGRRHRGRAGDRGRYLGGPSRSR